MKGRKMEQGTGKGVAQTESPIHQQLKMIDDRLNELVKTSEYLQGRLSSILSESTPQTQCEPEKPHYESSLQEALCVIRGKIESEILQLQEITNRLTI